jgi:hypothetical protein
LLDEKGAMELVGVLSTTEVMVMTPPPEVVMSKVGVAVVGGGGGGWEEEELVDGAREVEAEAEEGRDERVEGATEAEEDGVGVVVAAVVVLIHRFMRCKGNKCTKKKTYAEVAVNGKLKAVCGLRIMGSDWNENTHEETSCRDVWYI